ncbi:pyroglutamyl-peptidase [Planctomicrobium piriforme]|uniref:Pyroglutamyl-peptidase I n=2 Tax=Planctomicrobium piriforme TaxID=1576369 RepID=A0A1I3S9S8_9PLAN|nr:pyroglutamyl-peptidase [Planctomicrobium piriforme]
MRVLVTGFPPFPGRPENPSQRLVQAIHAGLLPLTDCELHAALLPVEYAGVELEFDRLFDAVGPDVWLAFGVGKQACPLRLERQGVNRDHSDRPDNSGCVRTESVIESAGPATRVVSTDVVGLQTELRSVGLPVELSDDAGTYVCNHLIYHARRRLSERGADCEFVFIHLAPPEFGLPVEKLLFTLQIMTAWFQNQQGGRDGQNRQLAAR